MTFSATDAAFEGFRVVRRKPTVLIWWTLAYLVFIGLVIMLAMGSLIDLAGAAEALRGVTSPRPEDMAPVTSAMNGIMAVAGPMGLLFGAVLNTAVARAVLEPERSAFGYLRLGVDELRVLAVTVALALLAMAAIVTAGILLGVLGGVAVSALGAMGGIVTGLAVLALLVAAAWVAARFSLAVPITLAERKIAVFDSWRVTRGRALPIVGMAILSFMMTIVVSILFSVVLMPLSLIFGMAGGWQELARMQGAGVAEVLSALGPFLAVMTLFQAVGAALQLAVAYAPFSAAYRDIKGVPAAE